ncbi:MAG: energy-coupling factor transporter transmembrane protein EcfT [Spirochaetales bacterium]|jgi:cobalt/nickel transport system permease protein|nr:energy-coupling factor transporter transmembrane protein EcfT [Spirochaetales bacterium]
MNRPFGAGLEDMEALSRLSSPLHRAAGGAKLFVTLVYCFTVASFPRTALSGMTIYFFYPLMVMSLAGIPWGPLLKRFFLALPLPLFGGAANLLILRRPAFIWNGLVISEGALSLISILMKTFLTVFAALLLCATTSFTSLALSLGSPAGTRRRAGFSLGEAFGLQLFITYRYLGALVKEAQTLAAAYRLRAPGERGIPLGDSGAFLGQLILRSFRRAAWVYRAMTCRGFGGGGAGRGRKVRWRPADLLYALGLSAAFLFFRFFNPALWLGKILQTGLWP